MAGEDVVIGISADSSAAVSAISDISNALKDLKANTKGGFAGVQNAAVAINAMAKSVNSMAANTPSVAVLANGINALKGACAGNNFKSAANALNSLSKSINEIHGADSAGIASLGAALKSLNGLSFDAKSFKGIKEIPAALRQFEGLNLSELISQFNRLNASLTPLAISVKKIATAWSTLPKSLRSVGSAARTVTSANHNLSKSFDTTAKSATNLGFALGHIGIAAAFNKIYDVAARAVNGINEYIEAMNLAQTVMGPEQFERMAGTANGITYSGDFDPVKNPNGKGMWSYAQEAMGIDAGEEIKYQGVFESLMTGMGATRSAAEEMSQQLTQLGYDISSFFNISVDDAMLKLQSGVSGELEPLRRIGYDLSVARMQQDAYTLGINENVSAMTQAEKVQLRYYEIITQQTQVHGDLARTLNSPANQMRVLSAQVQVLARSFGAVLLPVIGAVVSYITAFVKILQTAIAAIASFFGIGVSDFAAEMDTVDYSSMAGAAGAADDAAEAAGGAAAATKEWKKQLMGFDEINNLTPQNEAGGGGGGGAGGGGGGGLDLDKLGGYNFFEGMALSNIQAAMENLKKIDTITSEIGAGFAAWKLGEAFADVAKGTKTFERIRDAVADYAKSWKEFGGAAKEEFARMGESLKGAKLDLGERFGATKAGKAIAEISSKFETMGGKLNKVFDPIGKTIGNIGSKVGAFMSKVAKAFKPFEELPKLFGEIGKVAGNFKFLSFFGEAGLRAIPLLGEILMVIDLIKLGVAAIQDAWGKLADSPAIKTLQENFQKIADKVNEIFGDSSNEETWNSVIGKIVGTIGDLLVAFVEVASYLLDTFEPAIEGIIETVGAVINSAIDLISGIVDFISGAFDIVVGVLTGDFDKISGGWDKMVGGMKTVFDTIGGFVESVFNGIKATIRGAINGLIDLVNGLAFDVPDWVPLAGGAHFGLNIPHLASGGFPEEGQMFIAREAGPEMVGTMGGQTAVANNEQIIQGIASGVSSAMAGQNQLLMEQNSLLRGILAKEGSVTISATEVASSINRAGRMAGRPLITV